MGGFNVLKSQALKIIQVRIKFGCVVNRTGFDSESSKIAKRGVRVMQKIAIGLTLKRSTKRLKGDFKCIISEYQLEMILTERKRIF